MSVRFCCSSMHVTDHILPEDHIVPLISDARFAPDTLFIVAEEDWRLWKADCRKGEKLQADDLPPERVAELSAPSGPVDAYAGDPSRGTPWRRSSQPGKGELRSWGRSSKATASQVRQTSQELLDIVHMCNTAHRMGRGDLVWLSYTVNSKSKWTPTHGSTLLAVTARGGRILHENWQQWFDEPSHWDLCLRNVLREHSLDCSLPASYVFPAVGGFDEHVSAFQNTKKEETRECYWDAYNARQEGTRELDHNGRAFSRSLPWQKYQLKEFPQEASHREQNEVILLNEIPTLPLDQPDVWWTAAASIDPNFYERQDENAASWVKKESQRSSSYQPSNREGSPTQQKLWKWRNTKAISQPTPSSSGAPSTRLGRVMISHDQTWHPMETSEFQTASSQRRWRNLIGNFERRFFTNDPDQVGVHGGGIRVK